MYYRILTDGEKKVLLKLARETILEYLKNKKVLEPPKPEGIFEEKCGAFVTLHKHGELRGCIGNMVGRGPLIETIRDMAIAAATEDTRFDSVQSDEMDDVDIEISVLSPMQQIKNVTEIKVGEHGIYMHKGFSHGVLLPQVATEWGWDREEFLEHTCQKAGLSSNAWKDKDTIIEIFSADVFGEKSR